MDYHVLGPVAVLDGNTVVDVTPKQRLLLASLLIATKHTVSADRLIEDVFGEQLPANPDAALHTLVSRLRRTLVPDRCAAEILVRRGASYRLEISDDDIDAWRFEQLAAEGRRQLAAGCPDAALGSFSEALSLWRGPALADVALAPFAQGEAARLDELHLCAVEDHAAARVDGGAAREVAAELEAHVAAHPLRERLWSLLMVALARSGRQAEALRAYQRLRERLDRELGLAPSPEIQRLELAILRQEPGLGLVAEQDGVARRPCSAPAIPLVPARRFVGRRAERADLASRLQAKRVVTVVGLGGIGKTRLALEVVAELAPVGEVVMVDLAQLRSPEHLTAAIAAAVGARQRPDLGLLESLLATLGETPLVLLLDSCEQLLAPVAQIVATLVTQCPNLSVLATSREPLGMTGESVLALGPLPGPPDYPGASMDELNANASVELFVDRAALSRPGFSLDAANATMVARICRRLDGIPLALELAAARVEVMDVDQLARVLDDRFGLVAAPRLLPVHHQTLVTTLQWSNGLLAAPERLLLRRMGVFEGGATAEAAADVCAGGEVDEEAIPHLLGRLVGSTLVVTNTEGESTRYRLPDPVRDYERDQLDASGRAALSMAHALWCVGLAEKAEPELEGADQLVWLIRLDADYSNMQAALAWAVGAGEAGVALRLAAALRLYWDFRGRFGEGLSWLERALAAGDAPPPVRAKALLGVAWLSNWLGDDDHARIAAEQSLDLCSAERNSQGEARALMVLGSCLLRTAGGPARSRTLFDEAVIPAQLADDRWCLSLTLSMAGWAEIHRADACEARRLFEQALAVARASGDRRGLGWALTGLAEAATFIGDSLDAERFASEALLVARELGNSYGEAEALGRLAKSAAAHEDHERAETLFSEALVLLRRTGPDYALSDCLCGLGQAAVARGDHDSAAVHFEEARVVCERAGYTDGEALLCLGELYAAQGDPSRATPLLETGLSAARATGHGRGIARALSELGNLSLAAGEHGRATLLHGEALVRWAAVADSVGIGRSLAVISSLALHHRRPAEAARVAGAAHALWDSLVPRPSALPQSLEVTLDGLRERWDSDGLDAAWSEGTLLSIPEAVHYAASVATAMTRVG